MKVQLQQQGIRLRLDEQELARLLAGDTVANHTRLDNDCTWSQSLTLHDDAACRLRSSAGALELHLPRQAVHALQQRLPSREGLVFSIDSGPSQLEIRFDVDVRDSLRQRRATAHVDEIASHT